MNEDFTTSTAPFLVRRFEAADIVEVAALLWAGVMQSQTGAQTVNRMADYAAEAIEAKHHVWVAESFGRIIGSAVVMSDDRSLAHLRCLCVAPDRAERHIVAEALAELAIRDTWECGYVKLEVHADLPPNRLTAALHELGFEFSRERAMGAEHVLEFYQNLYERSWRSKENRT